MTRQLNKLSAQKVKTASAGCYPDGGGLYLYVSETGARSWRFHYMLNRKSREMGLGSASAVSLSEARNRRDECRKFLANKIDPLEARNNEEAKARLAAAKSKTFKECSEAYIEAYKDSWKNPKHSHQWSRTLDTYAYPVIGDVSVQDVSVPLLMKVLEPIWKKKTETASRLRGRIERILDWAKAQELRDGENPARWRGHMENLLPHRSKIQMVKHHSALPYTKIGDFMALLKGRSGIDARLLEFTILTSARTNESSKAKWEEITFGEDAAWTVPAERMKMRREHRVPLTKEALAVLDRTAELGNYKEKDTKPREERTGWIFPSRQKGKSLCNDAMLALLRRMKRKDITPHGFRSTFRDWAAEQTTYPREVA